MNKTVKLIIAVAIPLTVGFTSGFFTETGPGSWYQSINKPSWNPPNSIFAPVWSTLYVLMGVAFFLVWNHNGNDRFKRTAIILFSIQLVLNFFWSLIFFNQQQPGWALGEILVLWVFILLTIFAFAKLSKAAAWLMVPYISWVSFAAILNYALWKLNC